MSDPHWSSAFVDRLPVAAAALSAAVGVAVLCGWMLDIPWLREPIAGQVSMKANTAIGFVLAGLGLVVATRRPHKTATVARALIEALIFALGGVTLAQYVPGIDLNIDRLLFDPAPTAIYTSSPGRMSPTTAIGFMLFSLALLADHWQSPMGLRTSRSSAIALLLLSLTSVLGYAYGAPALYLGIDGVTAMALPSAILFMVLALGAIWLRPAYGLPAILAEQSMVGTYVRALLPIVVATPLLVGAAVAAGSERLFGGSFAIALTSLGSVIAAGIIATVSAVVLRRSHAALLVQDRALAEATNGILIADHRLPDNPVVYANKAFTKITGYTVEETLGRNCRFLNMGLDNDPYVLAGIRSCLETGDKETFEIRNKRNDGQIFWNRLSLAGIQNYTGETTHFVGIIDDISATRAYEEKLQSALEEARSANSMRDKFVRLVSHELRTPLNAALTWIRLMEIDDSPETSAEGLRVIEQSIQSQSRLIDDLVDVTRFGAAGARLEFETTDVHELVEQVIAELRPTIEPAVELNSSVGEGNYVVKLDPLRMQQVVRNLLSNANKYTPDGGRIDITLTRNDTQIELTVADTGKGLAADETSQVFEPFWRASEDTPGLGVGLAIAAALVAAHGGDISASSAGLGEGSLFTVHIPLNVPPREDVVLQDTDTFALMDLEADGQ